MDIYEARALAHTIVLAKYANTWKQPKAFLHEAIARIVMEAVATAEANTEADTQKLRELHRAIEAHPDATYEPGCDCDYCAGIDAARLALR